MLRFRRSRLMSGGSRGKIGIVIRQWRRFGRWRETMSSRFEEMTVIIGITGISLATQIFVTAVSRAFVKEVIFNACGGRETSFKLRVLGG